MEQEEKIILEEIHAKETANKLLSEKVEQIVKLIEEAKKIADEHKLTFDFGRKVGGYGRYRGEDTGDDNEDYESHGWKSSDICY
jgi:uncharacterized protein YwqG